MNICAVIPARAGSKGIPNKNIRLLNGKPLITYSIKNALNSKYINKIVVTTDSKEIMIISKQMGVTCHNRSGELCEDSVTLDSVIYDATKNLKCDYIVTIQPTSPTLNVKTLDNAIEYTIKNNYDTVISVFNNPHLSWKKSNGQYVPNYKERLNRQYLPENYIETGAFFITKKEFVKINSRIGENISVYEIDEDEAIDIDNFADMKYAETVLQNRKVAIYVNGNNTRGIGHIYRALELADEFYCKPDIYYDINQTDKSVFGETTHNLIGVNGIAELFEILKKTKYEIFINDILTTSIDYIIGLKQVLNKCKIINFEDDGEGALNVDLVFNALYQNNALQHIKTGEKYYISSKLFMFYDSIEIKEKVEKVFVSFGGADPQNYTDRILKMISQDKELDNINFIVVIGRAKTNVSELMKYNKFNNIEVLYDIKNMPEIMSQCDIAITSRGRTGYELAMLGIPSISMAQNKREEKHGFVCNENGFTYIGLNPSDYVIMSNLKMYINMSKKDRNEYSRKLLQHDLKNGRKRVMNLINNL